MRVLTTACIISGLTVAAQAQSPTTRIRGEVEKAEGDTLMIKTADGASAKVALASGYAVGGVVKATAADIRKGGFVGVGARPLPDGSLLAVQVFIFPEAMRGTGEGHRPWGVLPDSTMTNAMVAETVSRVDGANLVLSDPGGEQKVTITPEANIIMAVPAQPSDVVAGAQVAMTVTKRADGSFSASRVTVARPGAQLPY